LNKLTTKSQSPFLKLFFVVFVTLWFKKGVYTEGVKNRNLFNLITAFDTLHCAFFALFSANKFAGTGANKFANTLVLN
jgi:hypothetical protein